MRTRSVVTGIAVAIGTLVILGQASAQDEPYPVELKVGGTFDVCASGLVQCPAIAPICDNPKVAIPVDVSGGTSGLGFQGVGPGTTLCSAGSASGFRRVFRITVR